MPKPSDQQSSDTPVAPPLRLAVFGWVQQNGGSVSSAHHALCGALLEAGNEVDFFAAQDHVPNPGYDTDRFTYVPIVVPQGERRRLRRLPASLAPLATTLLGRQSTRRYLDIGMDTARQRDRDRQYDATLFLGTPPRGVLADMPTIVWAQCAPQNELRAVRELAGPVRRISGTAAYTRLRAYYEIKDRLVWRWARRQHLVLASHRAAEEAVAFGVPRENVCIAPYAVDLKRFTPGPAPTGAERKILCIGRLDPRKRIDLLVDAVGILATRRDDFHVEIIGRDGYLPGWSAWVEEEAAGLPLSYTPAVPQSEILDRLHDADLVVQPSEREEFGHAIAEALACGVPVLTGPTNGTGEWAPPDASMHFDRYEANSLADAMDAGLDASREPARRAACRSAAQAFDARDVARRVVEHIEAARRPT